MPVLVFPMLGDTGWISIKYGAYTTVPWALIVQLSLILYVKTYTNLTPWSESASELTRPSDRRLSAK
jgi:hypothetical protein